MNRTTRGHRRSAVLRLTRTVSAPAARVFAAWTTATELSRWFTKRARVDARAGGRYSNADGDTGVFLRVEPPRRVRFTWDNAQHCPGTIVDLRIEPAGRGRARMTLTHRGLATPRHRADMLGGWSWALDSLRSYLETGTPIRHEEWLATRKKQRR